MKTKVMLVIAVAFLSATAIFAQGGRPSGRPVNSGQERAAEVKLRNAENKAAKADNHAEHRQHGAETAQAHANEKGIKNSNERSALKGTGKRGSEGDHKDHAEKRKDGDKRKDGEKTRDGEKRKDGGKVEGKRKDG